MNNRERDVNIAWILNFRSVFLSSEVTKDLQHYKAVVLSDAHQLITGLETYHSWFIKVLGIMGCLQI